jgi:hypothetical protein
MADVGTHDVDLRYCVLDYSNQADVDFYCYPLIFLEIFQRPAADLRIGPYRVQLPLDWSIIIADKDLGYMEIIELKHLNDRDFTAFAINPYKSYIPHFFEITIENIFNDVSWSMPRLKNGHLLGVPLSNTQDPLCIWCARDVNRLPESLDITKIFV